ncbi:MAG: arginine--tRNA ligase [Patescibacteria group bacterium]
MNYLDKVKNELAATLNIKAESLVYPPNSEMGDLSWPMFEAAKMAGVNPVLLATQKAEEFSVINGIKEIKAVGPYLNFYLDQIAFIKGVLTDIKQQGKAFGSNNLGENKKVMIEYSNGNTHKELHVGHLRNISYGDTVYKLLAANGYEAIPVSYINDFGIHTAKTIWNWQKNPDYAKSSAPKGYLLGKCYSEAARKIEDNAEAKEEVSVIMKEIESRKGHGYELWQETRQWSIDYFQQVYDDLGIKFQDTFYENNFVDKGLEIKDNLLNQGLLKKSEGAIIADLQEYNLGVLPIIRSDGTALYPVADLALASHKFEKYNLDESIYIVDVRQSLYFSQLFKILELMGYKAKMTHLSYDFLTLKTGMMASRTGNVITYQELIDEAQTRTSEEVAKRHTEWSQDKINEVAKALSISAIKFEMIKVSSDKVITFDIVDALKFEGFTAAYLQYSGARMNSLLKKVIDFDDSVSDLTKLTSSKELGLTMKLAQYGDSVKKAGLDRDPSVIARYLFELAQLFNDYYHDTNIMKAEENIRNARLSLVLGIKQVVQNGFALLGLTYLEEM